MHKIPNWRSWRLTATAILERVPIKMENNNVIIVFVKKLLIIDGNAILHRAYHAYPPVFNDKNGNPTNAIYGFYAMLIKMFEEVKPDYLTICFDSGEPTFRMNLYAGYHANRPKMADDLFSQVDRLQE